MFARVLAITTFALLGCPSRTPASELRTTDEPVTRTAADAPAAPELRVAAPQPIADAHATASTPAKSPVLDVPIARVSSQPYTPPANLPEPIGVYVATQPRPVYAERSTKSALLGRIEMQSNFNVYELVPSKGTDGCSKDWAMVGPSAWVCTRTVERSEHGKLHDLPVLHGDKLLPFVYARHRNHDDRSTPALPVYRHLAALRQGADPIEHLGAYGTYAFIRRTNSGGKRVLVDIRGRVVPADDMKLLDPSEFAGRDLEAAPVPADRLLAWVVHIDTGLHEAPDPKSERRAIDYHTELLVLDRREKGRDGETWIEIPASGEQAGGWMPEKHLRVWRPIAPPEPILAGQRFVDVDLDQQTLTLWHEDRPIFATLIASGKPGNSTPTGLYRIITKRAYGKMASLPTEPEPYWIDAVPWTMYFDGRYALHAAFWHDRFGHRTSHGCVNLSPRDAKYLFEQVTPTLPPGWLLVNEHAADPGTLVRVHKGDPNVTDRRGASVEASALEE